MGHCKTKFLVTLSWYTARGGTSRQNSGQVRYRVRKLNSGPGPGQVITSRSTFVSSFFHTVESHYIKVCTKNCHEINILLHMIMYCVVYFLLLLWRTVCKTHVDILESIVKFSQFYLPIVPLVDRVSSMKDINSLWEVGYVKAMSLWKDFRANWIFKWSTWWVFG